MAQVAGDIWEHACVCVYVCVGWVGVSVNIYENVHEYTHILSGCETQSQ